jgi:hypothetical protein
VRLRIVRDDSQSLVLERKNPEYAWQILLLFVPFTIGGVVVNVSNALDEPLQVWGALSLALVVVAGMGAAYSNPHYESMTLDRAARTLVVLRKRLWGATRREVRFEEARAISVKSDGASFYLSLVTERRTIRFPFVAARIPVKNPNFVHHGEDCAAAVRAALGLTAAEPLSSSQLASYHLRFSSTKILRQDADALVLQDQSSAGHIAVCFFISVVTVAALGCGWYSALGWVSTAVSVATCCALIAGLMFCPYKFQYAFDRIGQRILLVRVSMFKTFRKELDFDQILGTTVYKELGRTPRYRVTLATSSGAVIDMTPQTGHGEQAVSYDICTTIEKLVKEALGLDQPDAGEPVEEPMSGLELAAEPSGSVR